MSGTDTATSGETTRESGRRVLGIIGGMGPMATVDLFRKIVMLTDAARDADHLRIIIDNRPEIPDRTEAILAGRDTPVAYILDSARRLAIYGADFLAIPCNTSHCFYERIAAGSPLPVLHMIEETANHLLAAGIRTVGLLATAGVVRVGVYNRIFDRYGIRVLLPETAEQKLVTDMIYGEVKAGMPTHPERLEPLFAALTARGAEAFVLGCTELPVVFDTYKSDYRFVDPTTVLARAAIRYAGYPVRS